MLFNSYIFIFLFLPVVLAGYYGLNHLHKERLAQAFLVLMSLVFYAYFHFSLLFLMLGSIAVNYLAHCLLLKRPKKWILVLFLTANLGVLGYFKYYDFLLENLNAWFGTDLILKHILLPLGISFFTFQQISFLVDTYKGETGKYDFVEYALFVSFFPQLVAGPIVTHSEMIPQFRNPENKKPDADYLAKGLMLFTLGLGKKILIADTLGGAVDWGYHYMHVLDSTNAILISLCYTFQLYMDFSGYCDMAKGIAYMLHITIPSNFVSPYKSEGPIEFWKRWHITLGRFFTRYVYIPLGGSREGKWKTCRNSAIVFLLSGLWHGANWTFVVWGVLHGIGYITEYLCKPIWKKLPKFLKIFFTFSYVNLAFVAFRSENLRQMWQMYRLIFAGSFGAPMAEIAGFFNREEWWMVFKVLRIDRLPFSSYYLAAAFGAMLIYFGFIGKNAEEHVEGCKYQVGSVLVCAAILLYCVLQLSGVSSFLYFNF